MTALTKSRPKLAKAAKGKATYRGVVLHGPKIRSQFSATQIKEAVRRAIAQNPQAFAEKG
jgi:hypothetical protein